MDADRGSNHGVLKQLIRLRVHDAAPFPKPGRATRLRRRADAASELGKDVGIQ